MTKLMIAGLTLLVLMTGSALGRENDMLAIWSVDPLIKVFQDAQPEKHTRATADAARGENARFQVVVRSEIAVVELNASVTPFTARGKEALPARAPRFVGYVNVDRPMQSPPKDQLRKPPADFPDPLLEVDSVNVEAGKAQPIWITVHIPKDAEPGTYKATVTVTGTTKGKILRVKKDLSLKIYKATIDTCRLWVTEWFGVNSNHLKIKPEPESEEYYALLERFAQNMAEHHHNVALISPLNLANFTAKDDGTLDIDFSRFDRRVELFKKTGVIGLIEGGHIGGRQGGWESEFVVTAWNVKDGKAVSARVDPSSAEADAFYAQFFPALVKHLREKGWLDIYVQHLADEPIAGNIDSYRAMAALIRKYAPKLRIIEACHTKDLTGFMDIWVPQLNFLGQDFDHYQQRQRQGEEVWFYTCVFPQGDYANRFIELPLIKTRLLHWINFKYGVTGYLHWGYNHWTADSPYTHTTRPHPGPPYLPAGDPWIVYPGENGPWDSIRFEAMADGIVDHELLSQLAEKDPQKAQKLASQHIQDFAKYNTDTKSFRKTRKKLLEAVSKLQGR